MITKVYPAEKGEKGAVFIICSPIVPKKFEFLWTLSTIFNYLINRIYHIFRSNQ